MKNQQHVFLQQEGEITALHQRSCCGGALITVRNLLPRCYLPLACPAGLCCHQVLAIMWVACLRGSTMVSLPHPPVPRKTQHAEKLLTINVWRRSRVLWEQKPSSAHKHGYDSGDGRQLLDIGCEMVKRISHDCWWDMSHHHAVKHVGW